MKAGIETSIDRSRLMIDELQEKEGTLKDLAKKVGPDGLLGKIIQDSAGQVEGRINEVLHTIDESFNFKLVLVDTETNKKTFKWGWQRDNHFICSKTLNDAHMAIFGLAFAVCDLQIKNPPFKVLMIDNVDRLYCCVSDEMNLRKKVLDAGVKLYKSGKIDNFIAAGAINSAAYIIDGDDKVPVLTQIDGMDVVSL